MPLQHRETRIPTAQQLLKYYNLATLCQINLKGPDILDRNSSTSMMKLGLRATIVRIHTLAFMLCLGGILSMQTRSEIVVNSLSDKSTYVDRVGFRIELEDQYDYEATLDGESINPVFWQFAGPGYHQFSVTRVNRNSGQKETRLYRFVVQDSVRGNSEWGLAPWTPRPIIPSAPAEFEGAQIELVYPRRIPPGFPLPMIGWIKQDGGETRRVNGTLHWGVQNSEAIIRRGVGSQLLSLSPETGPLIGSARIAGLNRSWEIEVEASPTWEELSGVLEADREFGTNARVMITEDLTVSESATLTLGAGVILTVAPNASITVDGSVHFKGDTSNPILIAPASPNTLWGGFYFRSPGASAQLEHVIVTGSGAHKTWFHANPGGRSHRPEEAAFNFWRGTQGVLSHVSMIDNAGQALHGEDADIELNHCLVQRCQTVGQFNEGSVRIRSSALIEFPSDSPDFVDGDNDALYFTFGDHSIQNTLIGWTKDDGIDAGANAPGTVEVEGCWIEACFHEGMALSGSEKIVSASNSVFMNNGQGVEVGYLSPRVTVTDSLLTGNSVGLRFGDNYFRSHAGSLTARGSISIFNNRDIWGLTATLWDEDLSRINARDNFFGSGIEKHPNNTLWLSAPNHPRLLESYLQAPMSPTGIGFFQQRLTAPRSPTTVSIEVGLSRFNTEPVSARVEIQNATPETTSRVNIPNPALHFAPGQTTATLDLQFTQSGLASVTHVLELQLVDVNAAVVDPKLGKLEVLIEGLTQQQDLSSPGSDWRYILGTDPSAPDTTAWHYPSFDDAQWSTGPSPLGFGPATIKTPLPEMTGASTSLLLRKTFSIPSLAAIDRLILGATFDDGFIAWINGQEIAREGIPGSPGSLPLSSGTANQSLDVPASKQWAIHTSVIDALLPGSNLLAVQVFNDSLMGSDLYFDASLDAGTSLDLDLDQLPDEWEENLIEEISDSSVTSILEVSPGGDLDDDKQSNLSEYLSGTDPLDGTDSLRLQMLPTARPDQVSIAFTQKPKRRYELQSSASPEGPWTTLREILPLTIENQWRLIVQQRRTTGYFRVVAFY